MTPIDNIREGIKQGKWSLVCQGFRELTGQTLAEPTVQKLDKSKACGIVSKLDAANRHLDSITVMLSEISKEIDGDFVTEESVIPLPPKPPKPPKKPKSTSPAKPALETAEDDIFAEPKEEPQELAKPEPDPFAKFRVQNKGFSKEGKVAAVGKPLEKFVNNFVDNKTMAVVELKETKELNKKVKKQGKLKPIGEREEFVEVDQLCAGCKNIFKIHPSLVPQPLESGEPAPEYRCDKCGTRPRK